MRHFVVTAILAGVAMLPMRASAQRDAVPGRDLLAYPIGLLAEPGATGTTLGAGLFNPADVTLPPEARFRVGVASMATPEDIGASAQVVGVAGRWRSFTWAASMARAAVAGLVRTDSDPLTIANDVPYATVITSIGVGRRHGQMAWGASLRRRTGQIDLERRTAVAADVGVTARGLTRRDVRLAASTFLLAPGRGASDPPSWFVSADTRLAGRDTSRTARAGLAWTATGGRGSELFAYASWRHNAWELRAGPARSSVHGSVDIRLRTAIAVRHAGYAVGIAREELAGGLAPSYQFVLSNTRR